MLKISFLISGSRIYKTKPARKYFYDACVTSAYQQQHVNVTGSRRNFSTPPKTYRKDITVLVTEAEPKPLPDIFLLQSFFY